MATRPRFLLFPLVQPTASDNRTRRLGSAHPGITRGISAVGITAAARNSGYVGWRLIGSNNRELGRSPAPLSPDGVPAAIARLVDNSDSLAISTGQAQADGWCWQLRLNGTLVAVSSRSYTRRRECAYSAIQFIKAIPGAVLSPSMERLGPVPVDAQPETGQP